MNQRLDYGKTIRRKEGGQELAPKSQYVTYTDQDSLCARLQKAPIHESAALFLSQKLLYVPLTREALRKCLTHLKFGSIALEGILDAFFAD